MYCVTDTQWQRQTEHDWEKVVEGERKVSSRLREIKPMASDDLLAFSLPTHFGGGMKRWRNKLVQQ